MIEKSRSRTHHFVYLSTNLGPGLLTKDWKSGKIVKVSSRSFLGRMTKGMRLSVSSRSRSTSDYQKVSVSYSSICSFSKNSRSRSCHKILVSSLPGVLPVQGPHTGLFKGLSRGEGWVGADKEPSLDECHTA
jgi:hypothetical protein